MAVRALAHVNTSSSQVARDFDLTQSSGYWYKLNLPGRILGFLIGNGFFALWLLLLGPLLWRAQAALHSGDAVGAVVQLGFLAIGPAIFVELNYIALTRMSKGPTRLRIDDRGLTFTYPNGKQTLLGWNDPRADLVFRDDRSNPSINPLVAIDLRLPGRARVPLPVEALDLIRAQAVNRGFLVEERADSSERSGAGGSTVIRIRRRSQIARRRAASPGPN